MDDGLLARYARHILLDPFGVEGQQALLDARVLVIGMGGLGCAAAPYLASAGVGSITLVDGDVIELSNLQRQVLFSTQDMGCAKVQVARDRLLALNPTIAVHAIEQYADASLLHTLVAQADVVLDCTDRFVVRHAINAACVNSRVPLVFGSAIRFAGQVSVFDVNVASSPCYACVFPSDLPPIDAPCALMGVFSPVVALVGALQVSEALKLLSGLGSALMGKLLQVDALNLPWRDMAIARDLSCPVCKGRD
ncbi:MAG: HesA/MoeB/ThiF family protein [Ottowia sp.]|nr:HesA/MoeB/ThiF family protein [Ottowia sp.]